MESTFDGGYEQLGNKGIHGTPLPLVEDSDHLSNTTLNEKLRTIDDDDYDDDDDDDEDNNDDYDDDDDDVMVMMMIMMMMMLMMIMM